MEYAVVGHVEWVEFCRVERVPRPGEIVHAIETWVEPAGGGAVAAAELANRAGGATLFTAVGDDELGRRVAGELGRQGVRVEAVVRAEPSRRAFTFVDAAGERTIAVIGERLVPHGGDALPWDELAGAKAVFFTGGDQEALRRARAARVLTATPRALPTLAAAGVALDAVVGSGKDEGERYRPGDIDPEPALVVATAGGGGGTWSRAGEEAVGYEAAELPGPVSDAYGCGDCFAAGLTYGLGEGMDPAGAVALASRCGADCLTRRGPYRAPGA